MLEVVKYSIKFSKLVIVIDLVKCYNLDLNYFNNC